MQFSKIRSAALRAACGAISCLTAVSIGVGQAAAATGTPHETPTASRSGTQAATDAAGTGQKPAPAPDPQATARQSALATASAKAVSSGKAVVVDGLTTDETQTTANADGTFTWTSSIAPERVKRSSSWVPIDTGLKANPDGSVAPVAVESPVTLSGGGSGPLATMTNASGDQLALTWPTTLPKPSLAGSMATYASVLPGVDLQVSVDAFGGFENTLIVHDAQAAANPALKTLHVGTASKTLKLTSDSTGNLAAADASGTPRFAAPPAMMWDSGTAQAAPNTTAKARANSVSPTATDAPGDPTAPASSTAQGPAPGAKVAVLPIKADSSGLVVTPDTAVLSGPDTTYPVYIDPSVTPTNGNWVNHWTWEQQCLPDGNNGINPNFDAHPQGYDPGVGYQGFASACGTGIERTFMQIQFPAELHQPGLQVIANGGKLQAAVSGASANGSHTASVRAFAAAAIDRYTTWNHRACTWNIDQAVCQDMPPAAVSPVTTTGNNMYPPAPIEFDMTAVVQSALNHGYPNLTVGLFNSNESDANSFLRFSTTNHTAWQITYDLPPTVGNTTTYPTPHGNNQANSCPAQAGVYWLGKNDTGQPIFSAFVHSPTIGSPADKALGANFHLRDNAGNQKDAAIESGGIRDKTVAWSPPLNDGTAYYWWADAYDKYIDNTAGASAPCYFTTDFQSPNQPALDPANPGSYPPDALPGTANAPVAGGPGGTINIIDSDNGPSGIWCYEWTIDAGLSYSTAGGTCQNGENSANLTTADGSGRAQLRIPTLSWGSHILRVIAVDRAGNFSTSPLTHAFYVPDNPNAKPTPGDVTGDGIPDLMTATPDGDLRVYQVTGVPSTGGTLASAHSPASTPSKTVYQSPDGSGWNNFQLTAHGSMHGLYTDDLFAHKPGSPNLYLYLNSGAGQFSTTQMIPITARPGCTTDPCDWSRVKAIAAIGWADQGSTGDIYPGGTLTPRAISSRNPTYLLAVAPTADGTRNTLWLYRYKTVNTLDDGIDIGTAQPAGTSDFDWGNQDLLTPGDTNGDGLPDLWTRDRTTGKIYQFSSVHKSSGQVDLGALGGDAGVTVLTDGMTPSANPILGTSGDLDGDGLPDLWGSGPGGSLVVWPLKSDNGTFKLGTTPINVSDVSWTKNPAARASILDWPMGKAVLSGGKTDVQPPSELDITGAGHNGTIIGGVTFTKELNGGAAQFDGSSGAIGLPDNLISSTNVLSTSMWFKTTAGGTLFSTGHSTPGTANPDGGAMPVLYVGTDGKLYGHFWNGNAQGISSPSPVNDGNWHFAALASTGGAQTLFLDGNNLGSASGQVSNADPIAMIGTGVYNNNGWPAAPGNNTWSYFNGQITDFQVFDRALSQYEVNNINDTQNGGPQVPAVPQGNLPPATVPAAKNPSGPGCLPSGPYGTVDSLSPKLQVTVSDADPTVSVHGQFSVTDITTGQQIVRPVAPSGDSSAVSGSGTVGYTTPPLLPGHTYAWQARTVDSKNSASPFSSMCHFTTYTTGQSVTAAPSAQWTLTDGSGTTASDSSPSGSHPATTAGGAELAPGGYGLFNGSTAAVATSGGVFDSTKPFTVALWARLDNTNGYQTLLTQQGSQVGGFHLEFENNGAQGNNWSFARATSDTANPAFARVSSQAGLPKAGVWTHLVASWDVNGTMALYVDGQLAGTASDTTPVASTGPLAIGRGFYSGAANNFTSGGIADVRVYAQVLSADQALWLSKNSGFKPATAPVYALTAPTNLTSSDGTVTPCSSDQNNPVVSTKLNPNLGASVAIAAQHAEFEMRDVTDPNVAPPIVLGGAGSASAAGVQGSIPTTNLINGHLYVFSARAGDGAGDISALSPTCYLRIAENGQAPATPTGAVGASFDNTVFPASAGPVRWSGPLTTLVWQADGNLVLYKKNGAPIWSSNTAGNPNAALAFQTDGDLVIYASMPLNSATGRLSGATLWASNTANQGTTGLMVQTDGNAVVYSPNGALFGTNGNVWNVANIAVGRCLDSNAQAQLYSNPCSTTNGFQLWNVTNNGNGSLSFKDIATGLCLDGNGTSLYTGACGSGNQYQQWNYTWGGAGWILKHAVSGKVLDMQSDGTPYFNDQNGGNFQQWD
ncbi:ricin-type beta-trefoil lectin domain protein [Catenulispora sp. NL8]|uniref:Ricin-type beta-trefoil lectin domain protein n=1 Tax=Catenulispora pinistramenti TaxID=2705254 RepID=A0ABS5KKI5_9ACTN|nr:LamG-like jellyroll fold domain-containing protein [Catenulispora pinistramenti]MBS2546424.1 ricin-type beta-trefoil lectin domain protein [Catenulispora pinistramenti]